MPEISEEQNDVGLITHSHPPTSVSSTTPNKKTAKRKCVIPDLSDGESNLIDVRR
jgi:hypothetical protein